MEWPWRMLDEIGAGTWPEWVAAVFTSLAFVIAAISYRRSVGDSEEQQARLVHCHVSHVEFLEPGVDPTTATKHSSGIWASGVGMMEIGTDAHGMPVYRPAATEHIAAVTVTVRNGSHELIGPVKIRLHDTGLETHLTECDMDLPFVHPQSKVRRTAYFINSHHPGQGSHSASIVFRDSSRRWWRRERFEPIERIHWDPANERTSEFMRRNAADNARAMGITPAREPVDPKRIRIRRSIRAWRGLPPVP